MILDREKIEGWRSMYVGLRHDPVRDIQLAREEQIAICDLALNAARLADALRGMVGLVQLVQHRYPDFPVDNHRVIEAMSALNSCSPQK